MEKIVIDFLAVVMAGVFVAMIRYYAVYFTLKRLHGMFRRRRISPDDQRETPG